MDFAHSPKVVELQARLTRFMEARVYPAEPAFAAEVEANRRRGNPWVATAVVEELKRAARAEGLWNLFLPESEYGAGLTNVEYAPLCEIMGRSWIAPEVFNCNAPDTGNMEVLVRYATEAQKKRMARAAPRRRDPLCIRDDRAAPSRRPTPRTSKRRSSRDGDHYVINGRKWWTSGGPDPRCRILIFMGKTDPGNTDRHRQQSMILVPRDTPGVRFIRALPVFGYDDAPHGHGEFDFDNVRVPVTNILLGEGRGFEIAQGRLGPGRIHHCMRLIGLAERALEAMCRRASSRVAFGRAISEQSVTQERIANARILIDQVRLLVLHAAWKMDGRGQQGREAGDRDDQGGGTEHGVPGDRLGDAGARRRRHLRRLPAAVLLRAGAYAALRRRPRRSASQPDREDTSSVGIGRAEARRRHSPPVPTATYLRWRRGWSPC